MYVHADSGLKGCGCLKKILKKRNATGEIERLPVASRASYCRGLNQLTYSYFCYMSAHLNYNNIYIIFYIYILKIFENQWMLEYPRLAYWVRP